MEKCYDFNEVLKEKESVKENKENVVNHPSHYNQGKIEVIDFIEDQGLEFHDGNAVKYICRYRHKGKPVEDLKKAIWYLERKIKQLNEQGEKDII